MAHFHNNALIGASGQGGYLINQSLRFNSADSANCSRVFSSSGSLTTWTWSAWVKRSSFGGYQRLFGTGDNNSNSNQTSINFSLDALDFYNVNGGSKTSSALFRDPSAWYHVVATWDTTNSTAADRMRIYVNGSRITTFSNSSDPSPSTNSVVNSAGSHSIGTLPINSGNYFNGYLAEVNFIDGTALTPSSFGETDTITGAWIPKKYSGSYGTNGFYLKFEGSGIGTDSSGNGNTWTASGFSTSGTGTDVMSDTPTNNFATYNPLVKFGNQGSFSDGNLASTAAAQNSYASIPFFASTTGKYYVEFTANSGSYIAVDGRPVDTYNSGRYIEYQPNGNIVNGGGASGASFTTNDIIGVAIDMDNLTVAFYKNNSLQATVNLSNGSLPGAGFCVGNYSSVSAIHYVNFGQRSFSYTPPTGFKALNTANLPEPTIKKGGAHFNTVLYTGNGSTRTITGVGFQPDLVWIKDRTGTAGHALHDAVRTSPYRLNSSVLNTESDESASFTGFASDGFSLAGNDTTYNNNTPRNYVAWNWKANGAGSSNTAGTITSTVSANATAGFSIVTFTGTGANATVGHGLGVAPKMVIVKSRSATGDWWVYHESIGATKTLFLSLTDAALTFTSWNNTAPTSSVFSISTASGLNANGVTQVAYCFSEVEGYSKFGSYTGNGSSDGPFVFCGFRPAWIMMKSYTNAGEWYVKDTRRDPYNPAAYVLKANRADQDANNSGFYEADILSTGFKLRTSNTSINQSGQTYIFAAFAELPFRYSNAR